MWAVRLHVCWCPFSIKPMAPSTIEQYLFSIPETFLTFLARIPLQGTKCSHSATEGVLELRLQYAGIGSIEVLGTSLAYGKVTVIIYGN